MPRYYFHLENGELLLDSTGVQLCDIAAVQNETLQAGGEIIKSGPRVTATLWNGVPWRMWVTYKPNGEGTTVVTLRLSTEM